MEGELISEIGNKFQTLGPRQRIQLHKGFQMGL